MSEHEISCVIIKKETPRQQKLEKVLRASDFNINCWYADDISELKKRLARLPLVLFFPSSGSNENEQKLLRVVQNLAPDCILANVTAKHWQGLATTRNGSTEICSVSTNNPLLLKQQIDYLFAYARLKMEFRQCKHLLSIAELRSQWLVDYAREAVAYIARGKHLHANIAYLTLFGFNSEAEAMATEVLKLVEQDDQAIFVPLSLQAEQGASPSNKLLMTLRNRRGTKFRAEIRFIPSVFRGRRCIQFHIHPLMRGNDLYQTVQNAGGAAKVNNPWQEQPVSTTQKQQQKKGAERIRTKRIQTERIQTKRTADTRQKESENAPTALTDKSVKQLHLASKELLNLKGSTQPALLMACPWLQYTQEVKLDYQQLLANAHDDAARFRIDYWTVMAALKYLAAKKTYPLPQKVIVNLGSWVLNDQRKAARLLKLLHKSTALNKQLLLALDTNTCIRQRAMAVRLLPECKRIGVGLLFDNVEKVETELLALLELSASRIIRTHKGHAQQIAPAGGVPRALQHLLQRMDDRNIAVVVAGVPDINALNSLCETTAAYLQGPILEKFSR